MNLSKLNRNLGNNKSQEKLFIFTESFSETFCKFYFNLNCFSRSAPASSSVFMKPTTFNLPPIYAKCFSASFWNKMNIKCFLLQDAIQVWKVIQHRFFTVENFPFFSLEVKLESSNKICFHKRGNSSSAFPTNIFEKSCQCKSPWPLLFIVVGELIKKKIKCVYLCCLTSPRRRRRKEVIKRRHIKIFHDFPKPTLERKIATWFECIHGLRITTS